MLLDFFEVHFVLAVIKLINLNRGAQEYTVLLLELLTQELSFYFEVADMHPTAHLDYISAIVT